MKINIGGQKGRENLPDLWKIVDISQESDFCIDLNKDALPFESNSVEAIYTSHTLEHIFPDRMSFIFSEMHRILKKDCRIRIVVPDISIAIKAYLENDMKFFRDKNNPNKQKFLCDIKSMFFLSWIFSYDFNENGDRFFPGHKMIFDHDTLLYFLNESKFSKIYDLEYNKCSPIFFGCDFKRYSKCSLYVEALK